MKDMFGIFRPGEINDIVNYVDDETQLMHLML